LIASIGSIHNLTLSRLGNVGKCLFVEGKDIDLLQPIHGTLFPLSGDTLDAIEVRKPTDGGGRGSASGYAAMLKANVNDGMSVYCILDRDFMSDEEIQDETEQARRNRVELHVWSRVEIENYLLIPETISRLLAKAGVDAPVDAVTAAAKDIATSLRDNATDLLAQHLRAVERGLSLPTANERARAIIAARLSEPDGWVKAIPGKEMLSALFSWAQTTFGVSLSASRIAREMRRHEIPDEVRDVLSAIEHGEPLPR